MKTVLILLICLCVSGLGCGHVRTSGDPDQDVDLGPPVLAVDCDIDGYFSVDDLDYDPRPIYGSGSVRASGPIRDTFEYGIRDQAGNFHALPRPSAARPYFKSVTEILVYVDAAGVIHRIETIRADHEKIADFMKREYQEAYAPDVGMFDGESVRYYYTETLTFRAE
ncbi:MAG: hypothetical protein JJU20_04270 [Opitutales bacterium]|nr:hypothetical protein [Opitutales bacterium]